MSTTVKVSLPEIVARINNAWPAAGLKCVLLTKGKACLTSVSVLLLLFEDGKSSLAFVPVVLSSFEDGKSNFTFVPVVLSSFKDASVGHYPENRL